YTLRWIEAYVRHDYDLALQYLNQYLEIVGPEHESYPTCLAYKADDLWHFGAQDSALYYAYKALSLPHTTNDRIEYICHHVMWNIYESKDMPDSASVHRAMHMRVKGSREFVPLTMNELKNQLKTNVISSSSRRNVALVLVPFLVLLLALVGGVLVLRRKRGKRSSETHSIPSEELTLTSKTEDLSSALNRGLLAFKTTSAYGEILAMKLNERELPLSSSDSVRAKSNLFWSHSMMLVRYCWRIPRSTTRSSSVAYACTLACLIALLLTWDFLQRPQYEREKKEYVRNCPPNSMR
ncbi:MAG: hypothetical protein IIW42_07480, partial [Bacteroidaceae bacterium]|nr:hypothetical protein [Bacteroidaceae bacterium]